MVSEHVDATNRLIQLCREGSLRRSLSDIATRNLRLTCVTSPSPSVPPVSHLPAANLHCQLRQGRWPQRHLR